MNRPVLSRMQGGGGLDNSGYPISFFVSKKLPQQAIHLQENQIDLNRAL